MLQAGLGHELLRGIAEERRTDAPFDIALSAAGAGTLLALVLLGPLGASVTAIAVAGAVLAARRRPAAAPGPAVRPSAGAERPDPWLPWRRVEPDTEYLRRRAA